MNVITLSLIYLSYTHADVHSHRPPNTHTHTHKHTHVCFHNLGHFSESTDMEIWLSVPYKQSFTTDLIKPPALSHPVGPAIHCTDASKNPSENKVGKHNKSA